MKRMDTVPALRPIDPAPEIERLAARYRRANGPVIALMNKLGGRIEQQLAHLPPTLRARIDSTTREALERAMDVAVWGGRRAPRLGDNAAPMVAALTGAAGGVGGLATAAAELPVTITLILHTIARAAVAEGFDPADPGVRAECLRVLAAGSPAAGDDGVNTSFIGARLALSGSAVQKLLATVAPGLAATLTRKLAAQAVPVLGAVTGAALNAAYVRYYRELAHIRFALLRLAMEHGAERITTDFARLAEPARITRG